MALTKIDEYEVMYSANAFVPRIWLKSSNKFIGQLIFKADGSPLPPDNMVWWPSQPLLPSRGLSQHNRSS